MKIKILVPCGLTAICFGGMVLNFGNADLLKCLCLVSSAVGSAEIARLNSRSTMRDIVIASAVGAGLVFGAVGFLVVVRQPVLGDWGGILSLGAYISVSAAFLCGILGALVGLLYYACTRRT